MMKDYSELVISLTVRDLLRYTIAQSDNNAKSVLGADDEARTRYLHLGKVALYQMSYIRILRAESLFCGKATAVTKCHWHFVKSRLSIPVEI